MDHDDLKYLRERAIYHEQKAKSAKNQNASEAHGEFAKQYETRVIQALEDYARRRDD